MLKSMLRNKLVRFIVMPVIVLVLLVLVGGGWYFSGVLEEDGLRVDNSDPENSVSVVAISDDTITLKQLPGAEEEESLSISAIWGITDGANYGRLGHVLSESDGDITREFEYMLGRFGVGDEAYLDRTSFPHNPTHEGLAFEEVVIPSDIGDIGAWYFPVSSSPGEGERTSDLWSIVVHGRTSNRDTALKIIEKLDNHRLVIDYRNDEGAPSSESGYYDFGTTEWRDVEAAVRYALKNGAKKIVLVGFSMGGGVVVNYQLKSDLAEHTVGIILEAPMLNFGRTVDKGAEERSVPAPITAMAKLFTTLRFGVDWNELDFLSHASDITVPVLLIHGDADDTVPIETSIEFAAKAPKVDLNTYEGVGHVAAWNWHPQEYETLVKEFIERVR